MYICICRGRNCALGMALRLAGSKDGTWAIQHSECSGLFQCSRFNESPALSKNAFRSTTISQANTRVPSVQCAETLGRKGHRRRSPKIESRGDSHAAGMPQSTQHPRPRLRCVHPDHHTLSLYLISQQFLSPGTLEYSLHGLRVSYSSCVRHIPLAC
jgi:hypothetical protein